MISPPRFRLVCFSIAALALAAAGPLRAAGIDDLVASLRVEVERVVAEAKATKGSSLGSTFELDRMMSRLEQAVARENSEETDQALSQLALARLSPAAKELVSQLQKEVPKAAEERQKALVEEITKVIDQAAKACNSAKTTQDLEPVLTQLTALRQHRQTSNYSEAQTRLTNRIDGVVRFISRWQDYLLQTSRGYEVAGKNILRELADPAGTYSGGQVYPLLTRTEILAKLGKDSDNPEEMLQKVKSLDELPKVITDVTRLLQEGSMRRSAIGGFGESPQLVADLMRLNRGHLAFRAGSYGPALQAAVGPEISSGFGAASRGSAETLRLQILLLNEILPRYLELPEEARPGAGENPSQFLMRQTGEAAEKGDWARAARLLDVYRLVAFGPFQQAPAWVRNDADACEAFASAAGFEKAGRFAAAVEEYQLVLRKPGKYAPAPQAAERLTVLQKEQPAAFTEAAREGALQQLLESVRASRRGGNPDAPAIPALDN